MIKYPEKINKSLYVENLKNPNILWIKLKDRILHQMHYSNQKLHLKKNINIQKTPKKIQYYLIMKVFVLLAEFWKERTTDWDLRKHKLKNFATNTEAEMEVMIV